MLFIFKIQKCVQNNFKKCKKRSIIFLTVNFHDILYIFYFLTNKEPPPTVHTDVPSVDQIAEHRQQARVCEEQKKCKIRRRKKVNYVNKECSTKKEKPTDR